MTTKSLDLQIRQYWLLLTKDEKQAILTFVKSYLKEREAPRRLTIEEYNKAIEEAEARMDAGFFTSHEDAVKESESW